ncbi:MAG: hydrogenase nickel incorporation protein HypA/HybF [Halobacteriales archaeon]|jgi:hydrogenase nickel incorporation protein HypA/HybF
MHEMSIADSMIEIAERTAADNGADRITGLTLAVGEATHVNPDQLRHAIEVMADGTLAADAEITVETVDAQATCECGWSGEPPTVDGASMIAPTSKCPECGSRTELTRGDECRLESITVPDD